MASTSTTLRTRLLRASVAHIPTHGFRLSAIQAALAHSAPTTPPSDSTPTFTAQEQDTLRSTTALAQTLFPNQPCTTLSDSNPLLVQELLREWDTTTAQAVTHALQNQPQPPPEGTTSFGQAIQFLEERLRYSGSVRTHLVDVRLSLSLSLSPCPYSCEG